MLLLEFNDLDSAGDIAWVRTCPCGVVGEDMCDPSGIAETAEGGYWNCSWSRKSKAQNRMNKCVFWCLGDNPYDDEDDWTNGAQMRCFREQGRKFKDGTRKFRELGKWIMGRNSDGKVTCEK